MATSRSIGMEAILDANQTYCVPQFALDGYRAVCYSPHTDKVSSYTNRETHRAFCRLCTFSKCDVGTRIRAPTDLQLYCHYELCMTPIPESTGTPNGLESALSNLGEPYEGTFSRWMMVRSLLSKVDTR